MGALGGSLYPQKGGPGGYYSSAPCRDFIDLSTVYKELDKYNREIEQYENEQQYRRRRYNRNDCPDAIADIHHCYNSDNTMVTEMNTITNMVRTLVLKHNSDEIKNLVSITKQDKTVGITFTKDFLIVMAVNDYVTGCIPIVLYARNFSIDTVYTRFLSTVGKMAIKGYSNRYFGERIPESHLRNGQLRRDYHYEAVQLAIKMDEIIKKDLKI